MLFRLAVNTPPFNVFNLLNRELIHFLEHSISATTFDRSLFSSSDIGTACWENTRSTNPRASKDLTKDKFERLFSVLQLTDSATRQILLDKTLRYQDLQELFNNPDQELLSLLPPECQEALKAVATHLYCATKELIPIITAAGGGDILSHFNLFRAETVNGNICKACGMKELAAFRTGVEDESQWRADYDHQLCKSKYPMFAVHPNNLIPLCTVCNQDAKRAKDLFTDKNGNARLAFYPYNEEAKDLINITFSELRDPEPKIEVTWSTQDPTLINKLDTWDDIYEIRSRVGGRFRSLEEVIEDELNPSDLGHLQTQINDKARAIPEATLKRKEWAFWYQKLFYSLSLIDIEPFEAKWEFVHQQGAEGGDYILNSV